MADLQSLAERLAVATGPDRELDVQLELLARSDGHGSPSAEPGRVVDAAGSYSARNFTASLDTALALVEAKLPPHGPISIEIAGSAIVVINGLGPCDQAIAQAFGLTPALAILRALVAALQEQSDDRS